MTDRKSSKTVSLTAKGVTVEARGMFNRLCRESGKTRGEFMSELIRDEYTRRHGEAAMLAATIILRHS